MLGKRYLFVAAAALGAAACATYPSYPPGPPPIYGAMQINVATKAPFGPHLVDGAGRAVYMLEGTRGTPAERCSGECLRIWPPLHVNARPVAGSGVDPARLSTIRAHGHNHVYYSGWTLFYYHRDRGPGDTTGQHVTDRWGTWHLLAPSGQPIRPVGSGY